MALRIGWRRAVLLLMAGVAVAAPAACGGGDNDDTFGQAKEEIRAEDQARADAIVLKQADLPGVWEIEPEGDDQATSEDPLTGLDIDLSDLTVTGKAESPSFVRDGITRAASFAAVLESEADARAAYERVATQDLADAFSDSLGGLEDEEAKITNIQVSQPPFPALGDQSSLYQIAIDIEAEGQTVSAYVDLAFVQRERAFGLVFFFDVFTPFPDAEMEQVARLLAERMAL